MPAPPSYDAPIASTPYNHNNYHQQSFAQRQAVYQRQAAAKSNDFGPNPNAACPIASGRLKIYPRELAKSPPFQNPHQSSGSLQQQVQVAATPKNTSTTSPLLSAFTPALAAFNFVSNEPPSVSVLQPTHLSPTPPEYPPQHHHNNTSSISVPSSYSNSNSLASRRGSQVGVPGMASPSGPVGYGRSPSERRLQHHISYSSFAENMSPSPYASSPAPSYQSNASHASTTVMGAGQYIAAEQGLAYNLDTLDEVDYGRDGSGKGKLPVVGGTDVVCLGWESGLDVWKLGRGEVELLSRMYGLTGSVVGAKILPTPFRDDPDSTLRPLVCLTIHSPILPPPVQDMQSDGETSGPYRPESAASDRSHESSPRARATEFQTSVEIYSLSKRTRVATLFKSAPIEIGAHGVAKPMALRVEVSSISGQGNLVVVGVAGSGELFLFSSSRSGGSRRAATAKNATGEKWSCLTKLWTIVQPETRLPTASTAGAESPLQEIIKPAMPIFSLEGRWFAYSPPVPTSPQAAYYNARANESLGGTVCVPSQQLPASPSQQPQANTFVDVPEDEAMLNRVAREVTQEVIRGAKWMSEQGIRAVKNYWSSYNNGMTSTSPPGNNGVRIGPGGGSGVSVLGMQVREMRERERDLALLGAGGGVGNGSQPASSVYGGSAPSSSTHVHVSNDPVVVCVLDLAKPPANSRQELYMPTVTFQPLSGLSFLSFSPGGLALLTVSYKGDVIHIWDMLKGLHQPPLSSTPQSNKGTSSNKGSNSSIVGSPEATAGISVNGRLSSGQYAGRHVRQIARFTRMTVAHIVDVSWSRPSGEKISVLTDKGTVHFYDLPSSAYQWPPPKRAVSTTTTTAQGGVTGIVNSAVQASTNLLASTQPLVVAVRRRRRSSGTSLGTSVGQDSGLGASTGDSTATILPSAQTKGHRVSLPPTSTTSISMGCVKYLGGKELGHVAMMAGGCLRIYESRGQNTAGSRRRSSVHNGGVLMNRLFEYELPALPEGEATGVVIPIVTEEYDEDLVFEDGNENEEGETLVYPGYWAGPQRNHRHRDLVNQYKFHPLSFAEIDTSNPTSPLHSDRRITLSVFNDHVALTASTWHYDAPVAHDSAWVFGGKIPAVKLEIGSAKGEVEFKDGGEEAVAEAMESGMRLDDGIPAVAMALNPGPLKKGKKKTGRSHPGKISTEDEGFFEDDCEVVDSK